METTIASYQEQGIRLQLVEVTKTENDNYPIKIKEICDGWIIIWSNGKREVTTFENAKTTRELYKMKYNYDSYEYIEATKINYKIYKIIKNRKIISTLKILDNARYYFYAEIRNVLYQKKLEL